MAAAQAVTGAGLVGPRPGYPVRVWAGADARASRGLWLVKWLLLVPHLLVLTLLWVAFGVLSLVAWVAIIATGRYPRWAFEFNVGVLRWSWRVAYYGYGALATDRYPPFTLDEVPDYPAHLEVDYPERLSRGLALVKWWLLAIPHYLVVGILVGSGTWWVASESGWRFVWGSGLVGLLVAVAGVVLLFTGRYPSSVYDLLLGLNRWVLRVAAYVALMTDDYPPFRLDQGPEDVGAVRLMTGPPQDPVEPSRRGGWTTARVLGVVGGAVAGLLSFALLTGGIGLLVTDAVGRDADGYVTTVERPLHSDGYAVAITSFTLETPSGWATLPHFVTGDVRLRVTPSAGDRAVFVGIAPAADVEQYLGGVARMIPEGAWRTGTDVAGTAPATPPTAQDFWTVQAAGTGTQQVVWRPSAGDWGVAVMNADASAGVAVRASLGAELPWLGPVGVATLVLGLLLLGAGVVLVALSVHRARTPVAVQQ